MPFTPRAKAVLEGALREALEILSREPPPPPDRGPRDVAPPRFSVAPDRQAQELLRAAAARALADGRDVYGPDDVRAALAAEGG
jgi:MoxR-like ATPase